MHEALLWNTIPKLLCFFGGSGENPSPTVPQEAFSSSPKYRKQLASQELSMQFHFGTERRMKFATMPQFAVLQLTTEN